MKNNKIYMILANLYDQVKGVIGDTGRSLSEEIDERVKNQEEVVAARKGHNSLLEKINAIDNYMDGSSSEIMELSGRINQTEGEVVAINDEIEIIKTTNPTVQLENGEHLLVNVEKRPGHKSVNFSLNTNEEYRTNANTEHYVSQLYVRDNIHNKEIDMSFKEDNSVYDKTIHLNVKGSLEATQVGEMTLPLHLCEIVNQDYDNIAVLPDICDIHGITNATYINENQHVASAFKSGYQWHIKSKMAEIVLKFIKPLYITSIYFDYTANTQQQSVAAYELVGGNWVELTRVPATDGKINVSKTVQHIKVVFFSLSSSSSTYITIKNMKVKTREYPEKSGITKVTELIDLYDLSGYATFAPIKDVPNDTICKFALSSTSDNECFTYYPSRRLLESGLFENMHGQKVIGDLKSSINRSSLLDYKYVHTPPKGNEGSLTFGTVTWSEDVPLQISNGYQIDAINYFTLKIKAKDTLRDIPINSNHLNKSTIINIDGIEIELQVKKVGASIKVSVNSVLPLTQVKYVITSLQNVFMSDNGTSIRMVDNSYTIASSRDYSDFIYCIETRHSITKNYYTWEKPWSWTSGWWEFSHSVASKYNQTRTCSVIAVDTEQVYANKVRYIKSTANPMYDENEFIILNTSSTVAYIGVGEDAHNAFMNDGTLITKDVVTHISPSNEFVGCLKRDIKQKVIKIEPKQEVLRLDDVEYFISYNNYNFYTYNAQNNTWVQTKNGMTLEDVIRIPSYAYEKLFTTENIYIKVKLNDPDALVSGVEIEFNKDYFKSIDESLVPIYGMNLSDIKNISAEFILNLINKFSSLTVLIHAQSKLKCWPYLVPGIQLIEYGGISWAIADQTVAKQYISGNMLIIKNVANEMRYFKLEQKFFEDTVVVVGDRLQNDIFEEAITTMNQLENNVNDMVMKVDTLDQSVKLLHDAMLEGTNPPQELPTFIIPAQVEVDLEPLAPGNSTEIKGIKNLRYVQFWDTQLHPVPEFVERKTVKDLQHHFIYNNGTFTSSHFEMDKWYDTDNAYLMTETLTGTNNLATFSTTQYTCTVKRSDGATISPRSGYPSKVLSTPEDSYSGWAWWQWASNMGNVVYDLPGEGARWVDFDFEFTSEIYLHGIFAMDFGGRSANEANSNSYLDYSWQITTIFLDYDNSNNWVEHSKYSGIYNNKSVYINKPIRKLRIRIEIPYSYNRGAGEVGFKHLDFYYCPVRYLHDVDATITPILYYNTETWQRLMSVYSDATIAGTATDIRYLFETNNILQNDKKYFGFNGSALVERNSVTFANGMSLQQFNNLTEAQLKPLLNYHYIRPIAILDSVDGHYTPKIRTFKINYAEKEYATTTLVNPQDVSTRYDKEAQKLIVTNATASTKTLKAIIS